MALSSRSKSVVVGLGLLGLVLACSCSSQAADGESCSKNNGCASGRCVAGACGGSDCKCETPDCRTRATCNAGWLCTLSDPVFDPIPRCRQECSPTVSCPSGTYCNSGVCKSGAAPFVLTWDGLPRAHACGSRVPCAYKVNASPGITLDNVEWTFGITPPATVSTKDPTTSFTYPVGGTYSVHVLAHATSGATATLDTTEDVCDGGIGDTCDLAAAPCCEGSCTLGLCK